MEKKHTKMCQDKGWKGNESIFVTIRVRFFIIIVCDRH